MENRQPNTAMDDLWASLGKTNIAKAFGAMFCFAIALWFFSALMRVNLNFLTALQIGGVMAFLPLGLVLLFPILTMLLDETYKLIEKAFHRDFDRSGAIGDSHFRHPMKILPPEAAKQITDLIGEPLPELPGTVKTINGEYRVQPNEDE